jgi:predicted enzyme related to lactoylglutathione lyase
MSFLSSFRRTLLPTLFVLAVLSQPAGAAFRPDELPPLNDTGPGEHLPGKFVWADLFTADPDAAGKFYCALLGWTSAPLQRAGAPPYLLLSNGHGPVAGVTLRPPHRPETAARWIGYAAVEDVDRALEAAKRAGGHTLAAPRAVPQRGTQALLADPEGAVLGVLQSTSGEPTDYAAEPGDWIWMELFAREPARAGLFYRAVLGYRVDPDLRVPKRLHFLLSSGGFARAGIASLPSEKGARPDWLPFVRVERLDATVTRALGLGGKLLVEPRTTELSSRFAIIADPTGGAIGLVELETSLLAGLRP